MDNEDIEILELEDDTFDYSYKNKKKHKKNNSLKEEDNKYFGFNFRIYIYTVSFMIVLILSSFFFSKAFNYSTAHTIDYSEKSEVDYKVYLKNNDFYDEEYLTKDKLYIASIIDRIDIDFDYDFFVNENIDLDFNCEIIGKLIIQNEQKNSIYYEKEYVLDKKSLYSIRDKATNNIKKSISIDYDYYNSVANSFKNEYKINPVSSLVVYFKVNKDGDNFASLNNNSTMEVNIPLSKQSVNISLNYKKINNDSKLLKKSEIKLNNVLYLVISLILFCLSMFILYRFVKLIRFFVGRKSKYQRYVNKLLRQYDRVIINSNEDYNDKLGLVKINDFKELLDLRDISKLPIKYYVPNSNKCFFYIEYENKVYLYTVKKVDYEKI